VFAVTVYGIGKTFYWPTLLGVISERFPKGGALALGLSGGIGMISAGLLGGPGIGYKQDYFAVQKIQQLSKPTYDRYVSRDDKGNPAPTGFPLVSKVAGDLLPPVAGMDNAKLKVFDDYGGVLGARAAGKKDAKTTLENELDTIAKVKAAGGKVEPALEKSFSDLKKWWDEEGVTHYEEDKDHLEKARLYGAKQALLYTAVVPAALAIGFLLLIVVFIIQGGYKQVHL
jgi:hypothetical protein